MDNEIKKGDWFTVQEGYLRSCNATKDKPYQCIRVIPRDNNDTGDQVFFIGEMGREEWHFHDCFTKVKPTEFILHDGMLFRNKQDSLWKIKLGFDPKECHVHRASDDAYMKSLTKMEVVTLFKEGNWKLEPEKKEPEPVELPLMRREFLIGKKVKRGGTVTYTIEETFGARLKNDELKITYPHGTATHYSRERVCEFINKGAWTFYEDPIPEPKGQLYGNKPDVPELPKPVKYHYLPILDDKPLNTGDTSVSGSTVVPMEKTNMKDSIANTTSVNVEADYDTPFQEKTVIVVYGRNVESLREQELYSALRRITEEQNVLKEMNKTAKSSRVTGQIAALGKARNKIVKYLDSLPDSAVAEPESRDTKAVK